ncbi:MAG TPA: ribonuclease HII [Gemmatimonadaceae bacterium]|nr:ribonuclease HII [Gemmatimonadaceae bacterium]
MRWSTIERDLRLQHGPLIAGVDEVGRGPLAGPVVACAVVMPPERRAMPGINDSKQLSAKKREQLVGKILANALGVGVGAASVREIDRFNILQASILAMRRALRRLPVMPNHVLVDGRSIRTLEVPHTAVVHGDARCYSIACASIVAKITRDKVMHALATRYPGYLWEDNVGYATGAHLRGIAERGITPHHRRSFIPCSQLSLGLDASAADLIVDMRQLEQIVAEASPDSLEDVPPGLDQLANHPPTGGFDELPAV